MCTRRTGGAQYVPDLKRSSRGYRPWTPENPKHKLSTETGQLQLEAVEQGLEILLQIRRVVFRRLFVHTRDSILAGTLIRLQEKTDVDVVGEAGERHLRRFPRQLRYPLKFR
jgi:hypothetical protein